MTLNGTRTFDNKEREKAERFVDKLFDDSYNIVAPLDCVGYTSSEPLPFNQRLEGKRVELKVDDVWAKETFDCAWLHITGKIPETNDLDNLAFVINCGGEGLVVDNEGTPIQGITNYASCYDPTLGPTTKRIVLRDERLINNGIVDFWVDCGANNLFGGMEDSSRIKELYIAKTLEETRALAFDLQVLLTVFDYGDDKEYNQKIWEIVSSLVENGDISEQEAKFARDKVKPLLEEKNGESAFTYYAVGHAHLDLAWLWPIRETVRKGARTFQNQIKNIERYPDYVFGASQAQLYDWIKEYYPKIYRKVKELSKTKNWEVQGATWVEMDSNLIGGESMIRQFYYGKKFYKEEFNEDIKTFWVPDSFGYSFCLPQVMKLAGVPYFLTQKLSWNVFNQFPYHSFKWQGLDSTEVLAHMLPENTYNSPMRGDWLNNGVKNYKEREISDISMSLYGIGDGGAGPGFEHIERGNRYKNLRSMPKIKMAKSTEFFEKFDDKNINYPTFKGELYLERHQGTYTTQARNKWFNRKVEYALHNYEAIIPYATEKGLNLPISDDELEKIWKEVLLYQFHDIIPGSSIKRVYDESRARYRVLYNRLTNATDLILNTIAKDKTVINFNGFSYEKNLKANNKWYKITIPALGSTTISKEDEITEFEAKKGYNFIENDKLKVTFKNGYISSLFDKTLNREFANGNEEMAVISQYVDNGDCWDMTNSTAEYLQLKTQAKCTAFTISLDGAKVVATGEYAVNNCKFKQEFSLTDGENLVNVVLSMDVVQDSSMLRIAFPTNLQTEYADFNIQFGHIARKTTEKDSFDTAQFEVSAHKFCDLSEDDWGLSLLNDCKYGFRVKHGVIDMDLIRSPKNGPGTDVDQGKHVVNYSLMPHKGRVSNEVYKEAYYLNNTPVIIGKEIGPKNTCSYYHSDNENVVLETVKKSDFDNGVVLRLYNCSKEQNTAKIMLEGYEPVCTCDIFENEIQKTSGELNLHGFELVCVKFNKVL